jgi:hypothetical protein
MSNTYDRAKAKFFQRQMYYGAYNDLKHKYVRVLIEEQIIELLKNEYSKDNPNDDEIEMKMFSKITQIHNKKAEEEREKEKEKENDTEEYQQILWTPEPSGDY